MISDFRAIAYLELHQVLNFFRTAIRQPGRVVTYLFVALYFASMIFVRTQRHAGAYRGFTEPLASAIGFGAIACVGLGFLSAARGKVGAFSSLADARFFVNSKLDERNVIAWLQIRSSWRAISRLIIVALMYAVVFPKAGKPLGMFFSMTAVMGLSASLNVPLLRMRAAGFGGLAQGAALVLIAGGAVCAAILAWPLLGHHPLAVAAPLRRVGIGKFVTALLAGTPGSLGALWAAIFALFGLSYFGSVDLYPELLSASEHVMRIEARLKRGGLFGRFLGEPQPSAGREVVVRDRAGVPPFMGAQTILWKEWLSFRRGRGAVALYGATVAAAALGGAAIGTFAKSSSDAAAFSISLAAALGNIALMLFALSASVSLASDVRKPIWWMCASPLRVRLYAWTASVSWRPAIAVTVFALAWSIAIHNVVLAAFAAPLSIVAIFFVRSIGLALYALFPSRIDQRGPLAVVRLVLLYALTGLALGIGFGAGTLAGSAIAGTACGFLAAAIEMIALTEFSSFRIGRAGASIAQAEAA